MRHKLATLLSTIAILPATLHPIRASITEANVDKMRIREV